MDHAIAYEYLPPGKAQRIKLTKPCVLQVATGRLWITQSGDPNDYFVDAGEELVLTPGKAVVLEAARRETARFRLLVPDAARNGFIFRRRLHQFQAIEPMAAQS